MRSECLSRRSWRSYLRALGAIAKKDCLYNLRYPLNAVFQVLQPIIWLTPVYFLGQSFATAQGNSGFAAYTGTQDYVSFILLGTILSGYVGAVFWGIGFSLKEEMDSGVLESNWMAPLPRPLFLVGRTLASLLITTLNSLLVLLLAWGLFGFHVNGSVMAAFVAIVPMLLAIYGFGFAFAALVLLMREANTLVDVSNYLISLLSGSQFPVNALPGYLLPVALAIPLTYGYDAVRGSLLRSQTLLPVQSELLILTLFMLVMVPLGLGVFKLVEQRCRALGTLGMH